MPVELINSLEDLATLEGPWNALSTGVPFQTWDWLATWWKHYGAPRSNNGIAQGRRLHVLAVFEEGPSADKRLIGVAPWYVERSLVSSNVLRWLGDGEVCTDHLSLICRPEQQEAVAAAVADALTGPCDDWDRIDLEAVDSDDQAVACLIHCLEERGCDVSRQSAVATWAVELPASWDDYLAAISKSHRKQLRQLERRVLETDRIVWHRVQSADELAAAWPILIDLHQRRRQSLGEPGCFASHAFHDFHAELAGRLLARGQLRLSWLELDGKPVAAEYHFAGNGTTYAYQGGVDPDCLAEEPGRLSTILCLGAAIDEGHRCVDFLRGDEAYKAHWRATPRATFDYRVAPNRRLARLRSDVTSAADRVTDWVRQSARRFVG